jgi:hypothetical protein
LFTPNHKAQTKESTSKSKWLTLIQDLIQSPAPTRTNPEINSGKSGSVKLFQISRLPEWIPRAKPPR